MRTDHLPDCAVNASLTLKPAGTCGAATRVATEPPIDQLDGGACGDCGVTYAYGPAEHLPSCHLSRSRAELAPRRLARFANVEHSIREETTPNEIALWVEQSVTSDLRRRFPDVQVPARAAMAEVERLRGLLEEVREALRSTLTDLEGDASWDDAVTDVGEEQASRLLPWRQTRPLRALLEKLEAPPVAREMT